jgi:acyl carrier protein
MKNKIIEYISTQLINQENVEISADEDLLSTGILDSLSAMKLIAFIEESFEIKVDAEDMVFENFISVDSMESFILDKKSSVS